MQMFALLPNDNRYLRWRRQKTIRLCGHVAHLTKIIIQQSLQPHKSRQLIRNGRDGETWKRTANLTSYLAWRKAAIRVQTGVGLWTRLLSSMSTPKRRGKKIRQIGWKQRQTRLMHVTLRKLQIKRQARQAYSVYAGPSNPTESRLQYPIMFASPSSKRTTKFSILCHNC